MIFFPYSDEFEIVKSINRIHGDEYVLLRLTPTMIEKNNLDANGLFRDMLKNAGIVDFDELSNGGANGVTIRAKYLLSGRVEEFNIKFYRVKNTRSDRRFSIQNIKKRTREGDLCVGDLLYISTVCSGKDKSIVIINLTHNVPSDAELSRFFGNDAVRQMLFDLLPKLKRIIDGGFFNNSKGVGRIAPKDVGDTLEELLGIDKNNRMDADYEGLIEIKSKSSLNTLDTLFTLRPCFDDTLISNIEINDRSRVSAFTRLYGYESEKHPGHNSLYITIGTEVSPQNGRGFYLEVNDESSRIDLKLKTLKTSKSETVAFWTFSDLKRQLQKKHVSTLWVNAEKQEENGMVKFKYVEFEFTRTPNFSTFIALVKSGDITYDWRGYTTQKGKYSGKNHGNAWRIKPKSRNMLFGEPEQVNNLLSALSEYA